MPEDGKKRKNALAGEPLLDVDQKILRAYTAALDAYNSGNWDATVTSCAKALEGITKTELPYNERSGTLGQLLEKLPKHVKLEQPMVDLAVAVKDGDSLGALFDLEKSTNAAIAQATLALLESFVTYVYLFKAKVENLKKLIELPQDSPAAEASPTPQAAAQMTSSEDFDQFDIKPDPYDLKGDWKGIKDTEKRKT